MAKQKRQGIPYSHRELYKIGPQPWLDGRQLDCVGLPLGGLGTGCISIGGWGRLFDWEIRNRPAKGFSPANAFFTLKVRTARGRSVARVLQGPVGGTWIGNGRSGPRDHGEGLPHFRKVRFRGEYPFARVQLRDHDVPLSVEIEAFNPFIPLNATDSGIPAAVLLYRFTNRTRRKVQAWIFGNHTNIVGPRKGRANRKRSASGLTGIEASNPEVTAESPRFGATVLSTPAPGACVWKNWTGEGLAEFWQQVVEPDAFPPKKSGAAQTGTLGVPFEVPAGKTITIPFFITWHFPTVEHWQKPADGCECAASTWKNWYATQWQDAWDVARYVHKHFERLHEETRRFHDAFFASSLPSHVLDAVSSQISTLKSPTVLRLEDGTFYGFEGCCDSVGCCPGSCTHVWNYAQALPYLFPDLQRSMRDADYSHSMREDGFVQFRMPLPLGTKPDFRFHPAADGQMGTVIQVYREWQISGDTDWLRRIWPRTKKALEFAWKYWDADRDGVMEGMQHNTYDIEFYGPNTVSGSLYLGALRAAAKMAKAVGESGTAATYEELADRGRAWCDAHLFNGEYYEQKVEPKAHLAWPRSFRERAERHGPDGRFPWPAWQYGKGCLSDQLLGEWYAAMLDLGHLYRAANVRKTLASIFRYNWRADLTDHPGLLRTYALNEEAGLLIGTWPRGQRPRRAFYFADEVWTGIEYQVAAHLIYEGMVDEGLAIALAARRRYDGTRRNPWNEIECGHHYARAMSSYALLTALSGFHYSAPQQAIAFAPRVNAEAFTAFFSVGSGWGLYRQSLRKNAAVLQLEVRYGNLTLKTLAADLAMPKSPKAKARIGKRAVACSVRRTRGTLVVTFEELVCIGEGETLKISLV